VGVGVAVIGNIDRWYADLYGAMSLAYRLSALIKDRTAAVKIAYHLRHLDSTLSKLFKDLHKAMEKGVRNNDLAAPEKATEAIQALRKLHGLLHRFQHACKLARLTNHSLMAGYIHNIGTYNEEIEELIQLLELSLQPETVNSLYKRSKEERERGQIFDLSEV
jgi:hypothetical protein